jgi:hypothetical protein
LIDLPLLTDESENFSKDGAAAMRMAQMINNVGFFFVTLIIPNAPPGSTEISGMANPIVGNLPSIYGFDESGAMFLFLYFICFVPSLYLTAEGSLLGFTRQAFNVFNYPKISSYFI